MNIVKKITICISIVCCPALLGMEGTPSCSVKSSKEDPLYKAQNAFFKLLTLFKSMVLEIEESAAKLSNNQRQQLEGTKRIVNSTLSYALDMPLSDTRWGQNHLLNTISRQSANFPNYFGYWIRTIKTSIKKVRTIYEDSTGKSMDDLYKKLFGEN